MLIYTMRMLGHFARASTRSKIHPLNPVVQKHRAWPWFCDNYFHVNNAMYLRFMEFGRIEWIARLKIMRKLLRGEIGFMMAGTSITYRHEIPLMRPFELETQLVGFDQRWLFFHQDFVLPGELPKIAARALVRVQPRSKRGAMSVQDFLASCDCLSVESPVLPEDVRHWIASTEETLGYIRGYAESRASGPSSTNLGT